MKVRKNRWRFYRKAGGPRQIGNRCKVYGQGCIVCETYKLFDRNGKFPSYEEAHDEAVRVVPEHFGRLPEMPWSEVRAAASIGEGLVQEKKG